MIRGVIFDMDGVLVDSEPFYHACRKAYLEERGLKIPPPVDLTGANEKAIWEALVPHDAELREELKQGYRNYQESHPTPFADLVDPLAAPVFSELKCLGLRLAIASSSDADAILEVMRVADLEEMVDYYISGEDCDKHKPAPEIYLRALRGLGLDSGEAIAVEDSSTGIAAAKNAGVVVYSLRTASTPPQDQSAANGHIESLRDVVRLVSNKGYGVL